MMNLLEEQLNHIKNLVENDGKCLNSKIICKYCLLYMKKESSCYTNDKKIGRLKFIDRFKRAKNILKLYYLRNYL